MREPLLLIKKLGKLRIAQSGLADDTPDDRFGQVKTLVARHARMTSLGLRLPNLAAMCSDGNFQLFFHRLGCCERIFGNLFPVL